MNIAQFDWQTCIALLIVSIAIIALLRQMFANVRLTSRTKCAGCSHCGKQNPSPSMQKIELFQLERKMAGNSDLSRELRKKI